MGDLVRASKAERVVKEFGKELNYVFHVDSKSIIKQRVEYVWEIEEVAYCIYIKDKKGDLIKTMLPYKIFNPRNDDEVDLSDNLIDYLKINTDDDAVYDSFYKRIRKVFK